ncbi:TonB-dependent receptor domain-containing protein [Poseidonocella sp. HB161398]|uniref:TonB-dependent receptor domain-containing protein n=1 Tax=Poseidonocella sp. HB161398 TaxID=2320855 RepID=UPI001486F3A0|nr:TonB-dependent receptor [Poseidonocella sp. HB161398]
MTTTSRAAIVLASLAAIPAQAQDAGEFDGTYIGSVTIGDSRRGVQTGTATSVTVIDQEEIEARQASTVGELIETVPGVSLVNGVSPHSAAINIRGLGSQPGSYGTDGKVSVIVDGVQKGQEEIYRNGGLPELEPELFRQVEVIRGPGDGFRYASGAIGGTVIFETRDASDFLEGDDTFAVRQKLSYTSNGNGGQSSTILAWKPDEHLEVLGFLGYRVLGDYEDGNGDTVENTGFEQPSAMLKGSYRLNDAHKVTAFYSYNQSPQTDVPYDAYIDGNIFSTLLVDRTVTDETAYFAYGFNPSDNDLIDFEARFTHSLERIEITSDDPYIVISPYYSMRTNLANTDYETERNYLTFENTARFDTGPVRHELLTGLEVGRRERRAEVTDSYYDGGNNSSAPGGDDDYWAVYATDRMEMGRLTLTPQLRYESQVLTSYGNADIEDGTEYEDKALTGALAARYALTDAVAVFGTLAYNENLPILDDMTVGDTGNINQSEKAVTREAGLSFDTLGLLAADDALRAKITWYQTRIWDVTSYTDTDQIEIRGAELEMSYVLGDWFADMNASMARGTVNGTGDDYKYLPADSLRVSVGKRLMDGQLDLAVEALHAWSQTRTPDTDETNHPGTVPSEAYTIYGLTAGYKPEQGALAGYELRASLDNILDETYRPYLSTRTAPGRSVTLSLAKTF